MPFTGVSAMDRKQEFVRLAQVEGVNRRELCRRYGVSASLGYRLLSRYLAQGPAGLEERSRRPVVSPGRTPDAVEAAVLAVRAEHPAWGGRKIAAVLKRRGLPAPAPSTVMQILRRHGVEQVQFFRAKCAHRLILRTTWVVGFVGKHVQRDQGHEESSTRGTCCRFSVACGFARKAADN